MCLFFRCAEKQSHLVLLRLACLWKAPDLQNVFFLSLAPRKSQWHWKDPKKMKADAIKALVLTEARKMANAFSKQSIRGIRRSRKIPGILVLWAEGPFGAYWVSLDIKIC